MHDRSYQLIARKNARKVSRMIEQKFDRTQHATFSVVARPAPLSVKVFSAPKPMYARVQNVSHPAQHATLVPAPAKVAPVSAPIPFVAAAKSEQLDIANSGFATVQTVPVPQPVLEQIVIETIPQPAQATVTQIVSAPAPAPVVVESVQQPVLVAAPAPPTVITETVTTKTVSQTSSTNASTTFVPDYIAPTTFAAAPAPALSAQQYQTQQTYSYVAPDQTQTYSYVAPVGQSAYPSPAVQQYQSATYPASTTTNTTTGYVATAAPGYTVTSTTTNTSAGAHHGRLSTKLHQLKAHLHSNGAKSGNPQM